MKLNKTAALIAGLVLIALFGAAAIVFPDRAIYLKDILTAIVSLTGGYIAFNVVNNGVKGKCWNQQMYDVENNNSNNGGNYDRTN